MSIFDSIGDYYACAKVSRVPAPPLHAVNRGILIEGICTFFSGTFGCGHATSTYGGNIGAIGLTKVRALISLSLSLFSFFLSVILLLQDRQRLQLFSLFNRNKQNYALRN